MDVDTKRPLLKAIEEGRLIELPACDKATAFRLLSERIAGTPGFKQDSGLLQNVLQREAQAITYLGYGIACPHARAEQDGELLCAIGWSPAGIEYGNADGWAVHLILMYYVTYSQRNAYLTELSSLARVIECDEAKHELVNLKDIDAVRARLLEWHDAMAQKADDDIRKALMRRPVCTVLSRLLMPDIVEMIEAGRLNDIRVFLAAQPAPEIAELITTMGDHDRILLFRLLPRRLADEVFSLLDYSSQNLLLNNMAQDETRQILSALSPDDRTALFEELPANVTQRLLGLLNDKDRKQALSLLSYPKDSVGRLMTNKYVTAKAEWTVAHTLEHIRATGNDSETMVMLYITDEHGLLVDDLLLRRIILAEPSTRVADLLDGHYAALHSLQDREDAVNVFKKYDLYALPVVDSDGVLLGIVTNDDILDVSEEEATEDFHKGVAVRPLTAGYLHTPLAILYRSRIPWLVTLVFINIFSGAGIAHFEQLIGSFVALVFFLPLLIGSGGNAGSQSATLVVRSMALGEVRLADFMRAFWREILVSIGLGLSMALAVFLLAWWRAGLHIGFVAALSMTVIVLIGSLMGMTLPFVLRKLKIDPAVASAPLVTSLADILGVLIYLSIASALLGAVAK